MKKVLSCILIFVILIFQTACVCGESSYESFICKEYSEFENYLLNEVVFCNEMYRYKATGDPFENIYYVVLNYENITKKILNYWKEKGLFNEYDFSMTYKFVFFQTSEKDLKRARKRHKQNVFPGDSPHRPTIDIYIEMTTDVGKEVIEQTNMESYLGQYYNLVDFFNLAKTEFTDSTEESRYKDCPDLDLPLEISFEKKYNQEDVGKFIGYSYSVKPSYWPFENDVYYNNDVAYNSDYKKGLGPLREYLDSINKIIDSETLSGLCGKEVNVEDYLVPDEIYLEWLYDFMNNDIHLYEIDRNLADKPYMGKAVKIK